MSQAIIVYVSPVVYFQRMIKSNNIRCIGVDAARSVLIQDLQNMLGLNRTEEPEEHQSSRLIYGTVPILCDTDVDVFKGHRFGEFRFPKREFPLEQRIGRCTSKGFELAPTAEEQWYQSADRKINKPYRIDGVTYGEMERDALYTAGTSPRQESCRAYQSRDSVEQNHLKESLMDAVRIFHADGGRYVRESVRTGIVEKHRPMDEK